MAWVTTLSTDHVTRDQRVDFWNAAACSALIAQCADPHDKTRFTGRMRSGDIGDIRVAELASDPATIWHSKEHVARVAGEHFLLRMQRSGESVTSQDGREVRLSAGDFTLSDSLRPYKMRFDGEASFVTLRIERAVLCRHVCTPERMVLVRVPGNTGLGLLASRLLRCIADGFDSVVDPATYPRLSSAVLDVVAAAYSGLVGEPCGRQRRGAVLRARILNFVELNLGDESLSPTRVAAEFGISRRYIHDLFASGEETLASYIWRRRLERARLALLDPRRLDCSLTRIAGQHGFKTLAHFSRSFRQAYGASPGDFREMARPA